MSKYCLNYGELERHFAGLFKFIFQKMTLMSRYFSIKKFDRLQLEICNTHEI